jgi:hypothetical protein
LGFRERASEGARAGAASAEKFFVWFSFCSFFFFFS